MGSSAADPVRAVLALSSTGSVAVAAGERLRVADLAQKTARTLAISAAAQAAPPIVRAVAFSPDGRLMGAATDDKQLRVWDTQSWECILTSPLPKKAACLAFSADGGLLLAGDKFGDVQALRLPAADNGSSADAAAALQPETEVLLGHYSSVLMSLAVSAAGDLLATCDRDGRVRMSLLPTASGGGAHEVQAYCLGHTAFVTCCAFVPAAGGGSTSELLLSGGGDGTLRLWRPHSGEQLQCLQLTPPAVAGDEGDAAAAADEAAAVLDLAVSADGQHAAAIVDGRDDVFLARISGSGEQGSPRLQEGAWHTLPGLCIPSQLQFDSADRLWVAGGPATDASSRVCLACAAVTADGKLEDALGSLLPADVRAEVEGAAADDNEAAGEAAAAGKRSLLAAYLSRQTFTQEEVEHRKRHRRDRRAAEQQQ